MLNKSDTIYDLEGLDSDLVKSIGDKVFKRINEKMKSPDNLIMNVKSLGRFIVRAKKLNMLLGVLEGDQWNYEDEDANTFTEETYKTYLINKEKYHNYKSLTLAYERYREKKQLTKKLRDEFVEPDI